MATFVLCHGAHSGAWEWRAVIDLLRADGHTVFAPTLTGLGQRVHLANSGVNLETHINDIANEILFEQLSDVVLVGHSYGGMVITGVADRIPERLSQLIYLDALVPQDGQSVADMLGPEVTAQLRQLTDAVGEGWKVPHIPEAGKPADPRYVPLPIETGLQRVTLRNPAALALPRAFIYCTEDKELMATGAPIVASAEAVRDDPAWRYFEMHTDHLPNVNQPRELADILILLAGAPVGVTAA